MGEGGYRLVYLFISKARRGVGNKKETNFQLFSLFFFLAFQVYENSELFTFFNLFYQKLLANLSLTLHNASLLKKNGVCFYEKNILFSRTNLQGRGRNSMRGVRGFVDGFNFRGMGYVTRQGPGQQRYNLPADMFIMDPMLSQIASE